MISYIYTHVTFFYTGVTLKLHCTAPLSQSESSNFFMYIITPEIKLRLDF